MLVNLFKETLSLDGLAEEIYIRSAKIVFEMIETIIKDNLIQLNKGTPTFLKGENLSKHNT